MVYFEIKLTENIIENIKKICDNYDIFIGEFLISENYKNFHNRLIDDIEDYIRKNYSDKLKIKNCIVELQSFHNILSDILVSSQKYKRFITKNNLVNKNENSEINFSYKNDNLFIK